MKTTAQARNKQAGGHGLSAKYVQKVLMDEETGDITITFSANTGAGAANRTLVLLPQTRIQAGSPAMPLPQFFASGQQTNVIDWLCTSAVGTGAGTRTAQYDFIAPKTTGTLPTKYAPPQCR